MPACDSYVPDADSGHCAGCGFALREHAEEVYARTGRELGQLVAEKQQAYGDSFGKSGEVLRLLYPDGIKPDQLDDALTVVRVVDKLFRIATRKDAFGETPWRDIGGYALLSVVRDQAVQHEAQAEAQFIAQQQVGRGG